MDFKPGSVIPDWLTKQSTDLLWDHMISRLFRFWDEPEDFYSMYFDVLDHLIVDNMELVVRRRFSEKYSGSEWGIKYIEFVLQFVDWAEIQRRMIRELEANRDG